MLAKLVLIFALFPFVGWLGGFDTQPIYLLAAVIACFFRSRINLGYFIALLGCIIMTSFGTWIFSGDLGRMFTYGAGLTFLGMTATLRYELFRFMNDKLIIRVVFIYISIAFVQILLNPEFASFLVSRSSEEAVLQIASGRGARSLTGEPQQFGDLLIVFYLFYLYTLERRAYSSEFNPKERSKKALWASFALFISLALLSQSSYSLGLGGVVVLSYFILKGDIRNTSIIIVLSSISLFFLINILLGQARIGYIFSILFSNPEALAQQGAFLRLWNIPITLTGIFNCFPYGVTTCELLGPVEIWSPFGSFYVSFEAGRAAGGILEPVLASGIFGLFYFIPITWCAIRSYTRGFRAITILVYMLLIIAGSPANPTLLLLLSLIAFGERPGRFLSSKDKDVLIENNKNMRII